MAVIQVPRTQRVQQDVASPSIRQQETPQASLIGANLLAKSAQFVEDLAKKEAAMQEQRQRVELLTNLSNLEVESAQRVGQLALEGTGDKPFVQGVMSDFDERKNAFLSTVPDYLQAEARVRLLSTQASVAKSAMGIETNRMASELKQRSEQFANNLANNVRFGITDEQNAVAQIDSFVASIPEAARESTKVALTSSIRKSALGRLAEDNPAAALNQIKKGGFSDVDTAFVQSVYSQASKALVAQRKSVVDLQAKAFEKRINDPAGAARLLLQAQQGREDAPRDVFEAQSMLGVPKSRQTFLTKDEAEQKAYDLINVENVNEFFAKRDAFRVEAEAAGLPRDQFLKDLVRTGQASPALELLIESEQTQLSGDVAQALVQIVSNPKAAEAARKRLDTNQKKEVVEASRAFTDEVQSVMVASGVPQSSVSEYLTSVEDTASIMFSEYVALGKSDRDARKLVSEKLKSSFQTKEFRSDGVNGYALDAALASTLTERAMDSLRKTLIEGVDIYLPDSYISEGFAQEDLIENTGWTMSGPDTLKLSLGGQPVYQQLPDGRIRPIEVSYDDLSMVAAEEQGEDAIRNFRGEVIEGPSMGDALLRLFKVGE